MMKYLDVSFCRGAIDFYEVSKETWDFFSNPDSVFEEEQATVKELLGEFWSKGTYMWNGLELNFIVTGEETCLMEVPEDFDEDAFAFALHNEEITWCNGEF